MEDQDTKPDPMVSPKARWRDYLAINPIQSSQSSVWGGIRWLGAQLWIVIKSLARITRLLIVLTFNLAGFLLWLWLAGFVVFAVVMGVMVVFAIVWALWTWMLLGLGVV